VRNKKTEVQFPEPQDEQLSNCYKLATRNQQKFSSRLVKST